MVYCYTQKLIQLQTQETLEYQTEIGIWEIMEHRQQRLMPVEQMEWMSGLGGQHL